MTDTTLLLTGIGLRAPHYEACLTKRPGVAWLEVHSENYFGEGGKALQIIKNLSQYYPISLHGVGLSLGSIDTLNWQHLKKLRELNLQLNPCLISEHLSWSSLDGRYFHDLLPLPYTEEALKHIVSRIDQVQSYLGRQILIENISHYLCYAHSTLSESDFLKEIAQQAGCGILLDINNIYISATNLQFSPHAYIDNIPRKLVQEIHLAGHTKTTIEEKEILIDTHNTPVLPEVWDLYQYAIQQLGRKPTIIEWDTDLPSLETLCLEAHHAEKIMRETYVTSKFTNGIS